jgi:hypothetical protein
VTGAKRHIFKRFPSIVPGINSFKPNPT